MTIVVVVALDVVVVVDDVGFRFAKVGRRSTPTSNAVRIRALTRSAPSPSNGSKSIFALCDVVFCGIWKRRCADVERTGSGSPLASEERRIKTSNNNKHQIAYLDQVLHPNANLASTSIANHIASYTFPIYTVK